MGCIIALAITVLCLLFLRQILGFLNVSNDLMGMAVSYIFIIIAGLVATFLYDACAAALRALGDTVTPLVSSSLEMVGKIVIAFTLVPLLGYTGVIVAEPIVWFIMVIPLLVKIYTMPVLRKQGHGI